MSRTTIIATILLLPVGFLLGGYIGSSAPLIGGIFLLGLIGLVVWILLSNKQGAKSSPDRIANALTMRAPDGRARIYVLRTGFVAGLQGMNVDIGAAYSGQLRSNFFMMADVDPGTYAISARMSKQPESTRITQDVAVTAGQAVLIDIGLEMGMVKVKPFFTAITDMVVARQRISNAKLIEWLRQP